MPHFFIGDYGTYSLDLMITHGEPVPASAPTSKVLPLPLFVKMCVHEMHIRLTNFFFPFDLFYSHIK